jgi:hypothetical protein
LNVRVLDLSNGQVLSTAQTRFSKDKFISGMIDKPRPIPVVKLTQ